MKLERGLKITATRFDSGDDFTEGALRAMVWSIASAVRSDISNTSGHFISLERIVPHKNLDSLIHLGLRGSVSYLYNYLHKGVISARNFIPFGFHPKRQYPFLLGIGLADEIQRMIAYTLFENFNPQTPIIHPVLDRDNPSVHRKRQLSRLGISVGTHYSLEDYCRLMSEKVVDSLVLPEQNVA